MNTVYNSGDKKQNKRNSFSRSYCTVYAEKFHDLLTSYVRKQTCSKLVNK